MKKSYLLIPILLLTSCGSVEDNTFVQLRKVFEDKTSQEIIDDYDEYRDFLDKYNSFSSELSSTYFSKNKKDNFIISPLTSYFVVSSASLCLNDSAKDEILTALDMTESEILKYNKHLYSKLNGGMVSGHALVNNSLWVNNDINLKEDCLNVLADELCFDSFHIDANNNKAGELLSSYIKEKTNNFLDGEIEFNKYTDVSFLSVSYLHTLWESDESLLKKVDNFTFLNNNGKKIKLSALEGKYNYGKIYKDDKLSHFYTTTADGYKLKFIVPNDGVKLSEIINADTINKINSKINYWDETYNYYTKCVFPEFETITNTDLKSVLKQMNIDKIFSISGNVFERLTNDRIVLNRLTHDAKINVTSKGIESGSYTVLETIEEAVGGDSNKQSKYETFEVNKNFFYLITNQTDEIVYSGVVLNI